MYLVNKNKNFLIVFTGLKPRAGYLIDKYFKKIKDFALIKEVENIENLKEILSEIDILVVGHKILLDENLINMGTNLKAIIKWGIGVDNIDLKCATKREIFIVNVPQISTSVAESTMLFILALSKNLIKMYKASLEGLKVDQSYRGINLKGRTLGIIGLGNIGSKVSQFAHHFGMKVLVYDPYISKQYATKLFIKLVSLRELLKNSDFVSINCPLTNQTYHMIGENELNLMKKSAFLINTARGSIVDEKALYQALKNQIISGAGLDVFEHEPLSTDNPLLSLENVICTPHFLAATLDNIEIIAREVSNAVNDLIKGKIPKNLVNKEIIK